MNVSYALEDYGEEVIQDSNLWFDSQAIWAFLGDGHTTRKRDFWSIIC